MQINLRKANAIQAEIRKAITAVKVETNITVSEFTSDVDAALSKGALEFNQAVERKEALNDALFQIRAAVGRANASAGISDILAEVENFDAKINLKTVVATSTARKEITEINARIVKAKSSTGDRMSLYGDRLSNVETGVATEEAIRVAKEEVKRLKREKQALSDKLLQLNVNTLIELTDKTKVTLTAEGFI
jgi:methionine synthase II (cobalamin-independent)